MAGYWLDLARFSETDGFLDDHHDRLLWPYRDWVIDSFARNRPFDEFATWQLAGDLLPNATREQILATAYLRVGKRTTENGAIDAEYKAEYMVERTDNALGTALLGLTVGCARCHDHKYDPIKQTDYYSLGAFFNSNDEPGAYAPGFSGIQGGPTLPWPDDATAARAARRRGRGRARKPSTMPPRKRPRPSLRAPRPRAWPRPIPPRAARIRAALADALAAHYEFESARPAQLADLPRPRAAEHSAGDVDRVPAQSVLRSAASADRNGRATPTARGVRARVPRPAQLQRRVADAVAGRDTGRRAGRHPRPAVPARRARPTRCSSTRRTAASWAPMSATTTARIRSRSTSGSTSEPSTTTCPSSIIWPSRTRAAPATASRSTRAASGRRSRTPRPRT